MKFLDILNKLNAQNNYIVILRHAEKKELKQSGNDIQLEITADGILEAKALGLSISNKLGSFSRIKSSPLIRCMQTASALLIGNKSSLSVTTSTTLGDPGAFVLDGDTAGENFKEGVCKAVEKQYHAHTAGLTLPGMRSLEEGAKLLLSEISQDFDENAGVVAYVTHDAILAAFVGYLIEKQFSKNDWINYLQGIAIYRDQKNSYFLYWDQEYNITAKVEYLFNLQDSDLIPRISK